MCVTHVQLLQEPILWLAVADALHSIYIPREEQRGDVGQHCTGSHRGIGMVNTGMELDLHSLFGLYVHSCSQWLRHRNPPSPLFPEIGLIYEGASGQPRKATSPCDLLGWGDDVTCMEWVGAHPHPQQAGLKIPSPLNVLEKGGISVFIVFVYMLEGDRQATLLANRWVRRAGRIYASYVRDGLVVCTLHCLKYTATFPSQNTPTFLLSSDTVTESYTLQEDF
jgi:hypothetical protein